MAQKAERRVQYGRVYVLWEGFGDIGGSRLETSTRVGLPGTRTSMATIEYNRLGIM